MHVVCKGLILLILLFFATAIGKKVYEPLEVYEVNEVSENTIEESKEKDSPGLLPLPLQPVVQAQELNYGELNKYIFRTPMASYEQVTNNRKWTTPENGSALFPPINGTSLYRS